LDHHILGTFIRQIAIKRIATDGNDRRLTFQ